MAIKRYIILSIHHADGEQNKVETTRYTPESVQHYLDQLVNDPTCVQFNVIIANFKINSGR